MAEQADRGAIQVAVLRERRRMYRRFNGEKALIGLVWWLGLAYLLPRALPWIAEMIGRIKTQLVALQPDFAFHPVTQKLLDTQPSWFGYVAIGLAAATALSWIWFSDGPFGQSLLSLVFLLGLAGVAALGWYLCWLPYQAMNEAASNLGGTPGLLAAAGAG